MVDTHRYWDGHQWTDHRQGMMRSFVPQPQVSTAAGYWCAFLLPLVGFILGITYLNRKPSDGVAVMVLSVVAFFIWAAILSAASDPYTGF